MEISIELLVSTNILRTNYFKDIVNVKDGTKLLNHIFQATEADRGNRGNCINQDIAINSVPKNRMETCKQVHSLCVDSRPGDRLRLAKGPSSLIIL